MNIPVCNVNSVDTALLELVGFKFNFQAQTASATMGAGALPWSRLLGSPDLRIRRRLHESGNATRGATVS
jgi:hypothetical protein